MNTLKLLFLKEIDWSKLRKVMKNILLLLLLVVLCLETSKAQKREYLYDKVRGLINDSLFSHSHMGMGIKKLFAAASEHHEFMASENKIDNFSYTFFVDQETGQGSIYDTILDFTKKNAIAVYDVNDTSLFVLVPTPGKHLIEGIDLAIDFDKIMERNFRVKNRYPIPAVDSYCPWWDVTYIGWDKNIKLYVLAAKPGKYLDDIYLHEKKGILPPEWEHGYSRGIAINEKRKEIYYWLVVW